MEAETQSAMDASSANTQLKAETATQGEDCPTQHAQSEQQSGLHTETLTHEPVKLEEHTLSDIDAAAVAITQKIELETLTPLEDAETQTQEKDAMAFSGVAVEIPTQSGDAAEIQTKDHTNMQTHSKALLQVVTAITGVSADSSPATLAKILQERWQEKEAETQRLREELKKTAEEKATTQAQVKNLVTAACSIFEASEESTPEDAAQKLFEASKIFDVWRSETTATWRERFRTMKNKMDLQLKTLADPIRLITGITDTTQSPQVLAQTLRRTWDQVQAQNDDVQLDLMTATDRVKHLEEDLEAQVQEIKDLKIKMEALTSSLEDLQLLRSTESKKKGKKRSKKLRLRWWKRTPEHQEDPSSDLEKLKEDLIKKDATISLLEAKMATLADEMREEKDCLESQQAARTELQNDIKLLRFDNRRKETLIQSLRDLVETLKENGLKKNRGSARYHMRKTADHATVTSMPAIKFQRLDTDDILPFSGCQKPGDLGKTRVLGKGTYGKVYLGRHGDDLRPIAIKQPVLHSGYRRDMLQEEKLLMKERTMKEAMMQQLLSGSPYFPRMLGVVTIGEDLCMVMDFIGNRKTGKTYPLYRALGRFMANPKLDLINMLQVCEDIIKGIMELHQKGYLHNDLKSNNVLLEKRSQRWHAVIIDLGLVSSMAYPNQKRFSDKSRAEYRAGGGYHFLAPEVVLYGKRYSVASDIFSFGVLLESIARKIQVSEVAELAESCTKQDPLKRPHSMEEIIHRMGAISASYY